MSWPTRTWTQNGWQNFNNPMANRRPEGLPADWEDHVHEVERNSDHNATFWDVIDNPLYEAAAAASNIDWDEFVAESLALVGSEEDYEAASEAVANRTPIMPRRGYGPNGPYVRTRNNTLDRMSQDWLRRHGLGNTSDSDYDNLTPEQRAIADQLPNPEPSSSSRTIQQRILERLTGADDDDDDRNWGINRSAFSGITDKLDTLHHWLWQTIKTHDLSDAPIIRRGPEGSDYGIDGDIWEHYGLDQAPGPPAEMDINYEFNLLDARPSTKTYATPAGYPQLDTSTEAPPSPTSYDTYMSDRRAEYEEFHDPNRPATSYGEPVEVPESASTMAQSAVAVAGVLSTT